MTPRALSFTKRGGAVQFAETLHRRLDTQLSLMPNGDYTVKIERVQTPRTLSQNRILWLWLTCIEHETGTDRRDIHDLLCTLYLRRDVETAGRIYTVTGGTSSLTVEGMTDFLNKVQAWAATELGITLPTPADLAWDEFERQFKGYI